MGSARRKPPTLTLPHKGGGGRGPRSFGESVEVRSHTFRALFELAVAASGVLEPAALAQLAVDHARDVLAADSAGLFWWDAEQGGLARLSHTDRDLLTVSGVLRPGVGAAGRAFQLLQPLIVEDYQRWEHATPSAIARGVRSCVAAPLLVGERALGALTVHSRTPRAFQAGDVRALVLLGAQVGPALEAARLYADSERRRAEAERLAEALAASGAQLQQLHDAMACGVLVQDAAGRITHVNRAALELLGLTSEQVQGRTTASLWKATRADGSELPDGERPARQALRSAQPVRGYILAIVRPDGQLRWHQVDAVPVLNGGRVEGVVSSFIDITDRVRAEERLRRSGEEFRSVVEHSSDIITILKADGTIQYMSPAVRQELGYAPEELVGRHAREIVHPEDVPSLDAALEEALQRSGAIRSLELRARHRGGSWRHLETSGKVVLDDSAEATLVINSRDITRRKQMEQALRQAEEKYHGIFEYAVEGIYQTRRDGRLITANPALARMFGYDSPEQMVAAPAVAGRAYAEPGRRAKFIRVMKEQGVASGFESRMHRKDGSVIWISETARAVRDERGTLLYYEGTMQDITSRKQAEEHLRVAGVRLEEQSRELARLEERERIAMDLHDGAIQSLYAAALSLAARARTLNGGAADTRAALEQAMRQINSVIGELRAYITDLRPGQLTGQELRPGLESLAEWVRASSGIHPSLELGDGAKGLAPPQSVSNVLYVAHEALSNVIRHALATHVTIRLERKNGQLVLAIRDNGRGFNPKRTGTRAGGGLRNIAERARLLGGRLLVESAVGKGTEVRLEVPVGKAVGLVTAGGGASSGAGVSARAGTEARATAADDPAVTSFRTHAHPELVEGGARSHTHRHAPETP